VVNEKAVDVTASDEARLRKNEKREVDVEAALEDELEDDDALLEVGDLTVLVIGLIFFVLEVFLTGEVCIWKYRKTAFRAPSYTME
jgi:hypothetical protein